MLRLSANLSLLFTEHGLLERIAAAKGCGFDAVEIQFPYQQPARAWRRALQAADVRLVLFNLPAGDLMDGGEGLAAVPGKEGEFRRAVDLTLDYAAELRPVCVNVLPGRVLREERRSDYLETLVENLRYAADALAPLGVKAVSEAVNTRDMPGFLVHHGDQMLDILARLAHPNLFMQYDVYHMSMMGEDVCAFISDHAGQIGHIQFADAPGRGAPGTGAIDFGAILGAVEASSYAGWLGAEYRPCGPTRDSLDWYEDWRKAKGGRHAKVR